MSSDRNLLACTLFPIRSDWESVGLGAGTAVSVFGRGHAVDTAQLTVRLMSCVVLPSSCLSGFSFAQWSTWAMSTFVERHSARRGSGFGPSSTIRL